MSHRIGEHLRSNVVGYIAIFLFAVGGTAYATHPGGANTISTGDIINGEVQTPDLATGAATTQKIATNSVTGAKMTDDSVASAEIADGQVTRDDLGNAAVDTAELAGGAVNRARIAGGAVDSAKIDDNSVASTDILDETIEGADIHDAPPFGSGGINGDVEILDGTIRTFDILDDDLNGGDINEDSLNLNSFFAADSTSGGNCTDDLHLGTVCASAPITLDQAGELVLNATGNWFTFGLDDTGDPGAGTDAVDAVQGTCALRVDGSQIGGAQNMGERSADADPDLPSHSTPHDGTMALTARSASLGAGTHTAQVFCTEVDGDIDWRNINLTAMRADN